MSFEQSTRTSGYEAVAQLGVPAQEVISRSGWSKRRLTLKYCGVLAVRNAEAVP